MIKPLIAITFIAFPYIATPQSRPTVLPATRFRYVEYMPEPLYDVNNFLSKNIHYPKTAYINNIEGRVVVEFLVDTSGNIAQSKIVHSVHPELDSEALRVISLMPRWKPAQQNGKPVKVWFTLPIMFTLSHSTEKK